MVNGLEVFKQYFAEYKDQYVLIGGAACDIVMEEFDSSFRATKDLDIVLIVEALTPKFGKVFWDFVRDGKYRNKSMSTEEPHFYRFDKPSELGFPYMLELFSRSTFNLNFSGSVLTPLHFDDSVSSLSAILLNDAYYEMLVKGRIEIDGVRVHAPSYLIPFKAKAWLDLTKKKENGIHVDSKDIKKHKNDVVRLTTILSANDSIYLPEEVTKDMIKFIENYEENPVDIKSLNIHGISNIQIIEKLKLLYL